MYIGGWGCELGDPQPGNRLRSVRACDAKLRVPARRWCLPWLGVFSSNNPPGVRVRGCVCVPVPVPPCPPLPVGARESMLIDVNRC